MSVYLAALIAASVAANAAAVGYGLYRREYRSRLGDLILRLFPPFYLAACAVGFLSRWTFAARASDGAVLGLVLWLVVVAARSGEGLLPAKPSRAHWVQPLFWLAVLTLMGVVMTPLVRAPSIVEALRGR